MSINKLLGNVKSLTEIAKINEIIDALNSGDLITVDSAISSTSENPVQNKVIYSALQNKQDVLIAGSNISIDGNTINATDTTYSAGDNITISNGTISATDTTYVAGEGISISGNTISNTQTSAEWGNIIGTLSDQEDLNTALGNKQDSLIAGDNITISGNTISASGTLYTAGDNISINNGTISATYTAGDNITISNGTISATDTTYSAGEGISIENGTISNTQTSAEWGNIIGTLSDQSDLNTALQGKQDNLTAGDNITINNGTISATDTTYEAGAGISILNGVISTSDNLSYTASCPAITPINGIATWVVTHNLGTKNIVCSLYSGDVEVAKNVHLDSNNQITITFEAINDITAGSRKLVILANGSVPVDASYDGQWVNISEPEIYRQDNRPLDTNETISLASYLPDDTDDYEVLISFSHYKLAENGQQFISFSTDLISHIIGITNLNSEPVRFLAGNTMIVPVGASRTLTIDGCVWSAKGTLIIYVYGYRKIGYGRNNNGLANTDLSNITNSGKIIISNVGMPSTTSIDLVINATEATYTAPSNGWFVASIHPNTTELYWHMLSNTTSNTRVSGFMQTLGYISAILLPVCKNDIVEYAYRLDSTYTSHTLKFFYAVGSESEVN